MVFVPDSAPTHKFTGIGYKSIYAKNVQSTHCTLGWLEIHAENYMIEGGPRKKMMQSLSERYPISCHGVGLSIGSETGLDPEHIERLKALMSWLKPAIFSEHLAWSSHNAGYFNDLLPLPYTKSVLDRVCAHIDEVQHKLNRTMLLENPSTYIAFSESEMSEIDFIRQITKRTGCKLLLDVNNVYVSATNQKYDPQAYIDAFPTECVGEIHLGGHDEDRDDEDERLLIDAHNNPVTDPVWKLYDYTLAQTGSTPTLVEWDNDLPSWEVMENEVSRANHILDMHRKRLCDEAV